MTSIAIIMFFPYKTKTTTLIEKINKQYCLKNNYDFYGFHKIPVFMENKNNNFCSYYYILEVLQKQDKKYDHVLYIDSKSYLCNHSIKIEHWLTCDKNIFIGLDKNIKHILRHSNPTSIKANVCIFKNSDWTIQFLNFILTDLIHKPYWKIKNGYEIIFRKCLVYNYCNIKQNISFIRNFNFNTYSSDLKYYIKNGGWILSLTDNEDESLNENLANQFIKINK
tara:strand:+ start:1336 stop:2004 length:669 start_codon:yes stop_codon:yes gene_type:complete